MHLSQVQDDIARQIKRDYNGRDNEELRTMVTLGLAEEAGEVAGLLKREYRGFPKDLARCSEENYIEELGDVLWYLAATCCLKGLDLEDVYLHNVEKLKERYGNGPNKS